MLVAHDVKKNVEHNVQANIFNNFLHPMEEAKRQAVMPLQFTSCVSIHVCTTSHQSTKRRLIWQAPSPHTGCVSMLLGVQVPGVVFACLLRGHAATEEGCRGEVAAVAGVRSAHPGTSDS